MGKSWETIKKQWTYPETAQYFQDLHLYWTSVHLTIYVQCQRLKSVQKVETVLAGGVDFHARDKSLCLLINHNVKHRLVENKNLKEHGYLCIILASGCRIIQ